MLSYIMVYKVMATKGIGAMQIFVNFTIYLGSALMIYNIVRYAAFVKNRVELEQQNRQNGILVLPLMLLIFFFIGYMYVGLSGMADLMMGAILFFGSVYVFIMLTVMYSIIHRIQDTEDDLSNHYEETKEELEAMVKDSLAVFRVNLTRDEVEERSGEYLFDSDLELDRYSELLEARWANVLDCDFNSPESRLFTREGLLQHYQEGHTSARTVRLIRRRDGVVTYVSMEATMARKPASGEIVAFLVERPYNLEMVQEFLEKRVLMDEYDRIGYIIEGKYQDLISNEGKKKNLLLPDNAGETYEEIYLNYILPTMQWDPAKGPNPMRPSVVDRALAEKDIYDVNAPFILNGESRHKRIVFYAMDQRAKYYLMLITDSTAVQEEQAQRNRELQEALDAAVRSNQARTRFFNGVSHQVRTPMNSIMGFTRLAREEKDPARQQEYLDKVELSGNQLLGLMDDLLATSLISTGRLELEQEPVDLGKLAMGLREQCCVEAVRKNITVRVDCTGLREPRILGDEMRLTQIMRRLMENACYYSPENDEIWLLLAQTGEQDPAPGTYTIRIQNRGRTIPEDVLDTIFQESAWESSDDQGALLGVGVGMAVTKAYIDAMNGEVSVTSSPEKGTEFLIRLPLVPLPREEEEAAGEDAAYSVLLVDDNEINREIGELQLTGVGFTVDLAENGAEAVEKVAASTPGAYDAVLMDVQMPVMNGYEATAAIRALEDPALRSIPIIALTANAYQEDMNTALEVGMDDYTTKPLEPEKIIAAIRKARGK